MNMAGGQMCQIPKIIFRRNGQEPSEFEDVAIYFFEDEWKHLKEEQKELYKDVTMENYQTLRSLGLVNRKPTVVSKIERGEDPYMAGHRDVKVEDIPIDRFMTRKFLDGRHRFFSSLYFEREDNSVTSQEQHNISRATTNQRSEKCRVKMALETNSCVRENPTEPCVNRPKEDKMADTLAVDGNFSKSNKAQEVDNKVACFECGKCFISTSVLLKHQRTHTGEKPYKCSECGKCFITHTHLVLHYRSHTGEKPYQCSECGKFFSCDSHLNRHKRIHTGEKPFVCSQCGMRFAAKSYLTRHQELHTINKPFVCSECGKCFKTNSYLIRHQPTHLIEKPFACPQCGKYFGQKSSLNVHMRDHTEDKIFICSLCSKCFTNRAKLDAHERYHRAERKLECSECEKSFAYSSQLVLHQRIHTGEKPFACSECGKCFRRNANLLKHQKTHNGLTLVPWLGASVTAESPTL